MALSSGLSLWLYPAAVLSTPPTGLRDYRAMVTSLDFTTVAPGGYGTLSATLALSAKHLVRPELQLFARLALKSRGQNVFLGEITEINLTGQGADQAVQITALGVGNCLRDDALNVSYSAKTAKQIIDDQFNGSWGRGNHNYPMSFDQSQVFPDNPATAYTLSYAWRTIEEILSDICTLAGGYIWAVWDHPITEDALGFSVGRLEAHLRDTSTTHYEAAIQTGEVSQYTVTQSSERAYNIVNIGYNEPSSGPPAYVTALDGRLNAVTGAINIAPFRRRRYIRDFAGNSAASSANAQIIANTILAQYKNGGNKISLSITALRDNNGVRIPLAEVRADKNIYVPDLAGRGLTAPAFAQANVNQFYIISTKYSEDQSGATLELTCDNWANSVDVLVARLQLEAERRARTGDKKTEQLQALGAAVKGWANGSYIASAGAQAFSLQGTFFRPILYQAPTSISWAAATYQVNCTGPSVNNITQYGFNGFITSSAGGALSYGGNFTTVGNCIYDLDMEAGTFTHHHGACGLLRKGLKIKGNIIVEHDPAGQASMRIACPCGGGEAYNLNLGPLRERPGEQNDDGRIYHNSQHDAEQARHIRALMRHKHVGLATHVKQK